MKKKTLIILNLLAVAAWIGFFAFVYTSCPSTGCGAAGLAFVPFLFIPVILTTIAAVADIYALVRHVVPVNRRSLVKWITIAIVIGGFLLLQLATYILIRTMYPELPL